MADNNTNSIADETGKTYVGVTVFDCKSCGRKGFESSMGKKHAETCLSKTVVFISKMKTNKAVEHIMTDVKYENLLLLYIYYYYCFFFLFCIIIVCFL